MADDGHTPGGNQSAGAMHHLVRIELDEADAPRRTAEAEHERAIAIYDILEQNSFGLVGPAERVLDAPFHLYLRAVG